METAFLLTKSSNIKELLLLPIYDKKGAITGVLGIDCDATYIKNVLNNIINTIVILGVIMIVLSAIVSIGLANSIAKGLRIVNKKLDDLVSNDGISHKRYLYPPMMKFAILRITSIIY